MLQDISNLLNKFVDFYIEKKSQKGHFDNFENCYKYSFLNSPAEIDSHFSTNIAMLLTCIKKEKPEEIFEEFLSFLKQNNVLNNFENVFFTKPGFFNFKIKNKDIFNFFTDIAKFYDKNITPNIGKGEEINIEFVSCNPTGPMHVGHTRGAIVGEGICSIFEKVGYKVFREFGINDNGNQFEKLVESVIFRYENLENPNEEEVLKVIFEKEMYPGDYIVDIAKKIQKNEENFDKMTLAEKERFTKNFALKEIMEDIKKTLLRMKIKYDAFTSVQGLIDKADLNSILKKLEEKKLIYYGEIDNEDKEEIVKTNPIGTQDKRTEDKFLFFKTTDFGDDKDRVLMRKDGSLTYFGGDLVYHKDKIEKGFDKMILVLGEDHKGYEKRMKAIVKSLKETANIDIVLTNLVKFQKNGEEIKMSKRKGNFLTTNDVLDEISVDILKFIILSYKKNTNILFDFEKSISQTKENPVFYVQYGYSRICSILSKILEKYPHFEKASVDDFENLNLNTFQFYNFDKIFTKLIFYPEILKQCVKNFEPYFIVNYIIELSSLFHSAWNYGTENNVKFITEDEKEVYKNFVILNSIKNIINSVLDTLKIKPLERM